MAQTLHRILVHVVFSTKDRGPLLKEPIRPQLFADLGGIVRSLGGGPLIVNCVADHVHMRLRRPSTVTLAEAMRRKSVVATFRRKKEKLRGGWVQSANFASECARKLLIL